MELNQTKEFNVVLGENGRIIIPVLFRKILNLKAGDQVMIKLSHDNDIILHSPKQSLKKLQALIKSKNTNESLVDSFIERRKEEI
jgi:AbrB family looped-hinge helix DNA binding protein